MFWVFTGLELMFQPVKASNGLPMDDPMLVAYEGSLIPATWAATLVDGSIPAGCSFDLRFVGTGQYPG